MALLREAGNAWNLSRILVEYGHCALGSGDEELARRCFAEALQAACAAQIDLPALDALAGIATLQARRGAYGETLALVLCILQHPAASQDARSHAGRLRADLASRLGPEALAGARATAHSSPCEGVCAY